jgi:hypothetical protein
LGKFKALKTFSEAVGFLECDPLFESTLSSKEKQQIRIVFVTVTSLCNEIRSIEL